MNTPHPILNKLISIGKLTPEHTVTIQKQHQTQGKSVKHIAIEHNFITEEDYLCALATLLNTELIVQTTDITDRSLKEIVPAEIAQLHQIIPISSDNESVVLAISDVPSQTSTDELSFMLSKRVHYVVASEKWIKTSLSKLSKDENSTTATKDCTEAESNTQQASSTEPVIHLVNLVLQQAVKDRASDIHFEPFEDEFKIRYRVDGALYEMEPPALSLARPIISRIKIISGLDIAETRLPQDGRIQQVISGRSIDFRVSTLPTLFGESVVLRVLDRSNVQLDIKNIGFPDDVRRKFIEDIEQPNGIVIVTGPTGSGKTTTLYAALQHINQPDTKILTAEDPVEYDVEGIVQLAIQENIGLDFPSALRSFLRQDPDIIMVGEIRDPATAQIAIQASLTGHLVFSTLHTNDAAGAVTRLIDMDIEPYLIASTLEAVIGQRLVRTICPHCKTAYHPDNTELELLGISCDHLDGKPFFRGIGCNTCNQSGYNGRLAIFEYLRINDSLRTAIIERKPTLELRREAIKQGMRTLREDGIRSIIDGLTTTEEIIQYTS